MNKIILIDTENIGKREYDYMANLSDYKMIFFETKATVTREIPLSTAVKLSQAKIKFEFLSVDTKGKNALDFQICAYAGKLNKWNSKVYILSRDKGYDNLKSLNIHRTDSLENLKSINCNSLEMFVQKIKSLTDLNILKYSKIEKKQYIKVKSVIAEICNKYANDNEFIENIIECIKQKDSSLLNDILQKKFRGSNLTVERELYKVLSKLKFEILKNNSPVKSMNFINTIFKKISEIKSCNACKKVENIVTDKCNQYMDDKEFIVNIINGMNDNNMSLIGNTIHNKFKESDPATEKELYIDLINSISERKVDLNICYKKVRKIISEQCNQYSDDEKFIDDIVEGIKYKNITWVYEAIYTKTQDVGKTLKRHLLREFKSLIANDDIYKMNCFSKIVRFISHKYNSCNPNSSYYIVKNIVSEKCSRFRDDNEFITKIVDGVNKKDITIINNVIQCKFRSSDPVIEKQLLISLKQAM